MLQCETSFTNMCGFTFQDLLWVLITIHNCEFHWAEEGMNIPFGKNLHFVNILKTDWTILTKFCNFDPDFNRNITTPLYLKFKMIWYSFKNGTGKLSVVLFKVSTFCNESCFSIIQCSTYFIILQNKGKNSSFEWETQQNSSTQIL